MWVFRDGLVFNSEGEPAPWPKLLLFGQPVSHSLSPTMHAAAIETAGVDSSYEAIELSPADLESGLRHAHEGGVHGINLTLPHKTAALAHVVRKSEEVERIGASNTLLRQEDGWAAHNTDARGFATALQRWLGREMSASLREVRIIGAGGAARAVVEALYALGARRVLVLARAPERAQWAIERAVEVQALDSAELHGTSLLIQATSLGISSQDPSPIVGKEIPSDSAALDLCYGAHQTRFLHDAALAGCRVEDGWRMLAAQGALAFTMWYGGIVPLAVMSQALDHDW